MRRAVVRVRTRLVEAVDVAAVRRDDRGARFRGTVERDCVLHGVAVSPTHRLPGGDGDGVARELYGGHVDLCRDRGAGRAERGGLRRAVEPRAEALQVERDRELEAIEDVLWRGDPLRRALDRGAGSGAG